MKARARLLLAVSLLVVLAVVDGCGGSDAKRPVGLQPVEVVTHFFDAVKNRNYSEAALYVAPGASDRAELGEIKSTANLLAVKKVAQKGDFAVVTATIQEGQNNFNFTVKTVGLERIDGEWYILDSKQIYQDAKYRLLLELLEKI